MLEVIGLSKVFRTADREQSRVVDNVSFGIPDGQCYALLGPSGCGKTTTLRCVAGLEQADSGVVRIGGTVVSDPARGTFLPVHERPIGMVFQSYAIWPHMDVFGNVSYPLTVGRSRPEKTEIKDRTMQALTQVGMQDMANRPASRLSGGQQQRVALARAVVRQPKLLLLDEPLSNLDARLRETMRQELSDMIARIGVTALYVTHDQAEAFALAHRMGVMDRGRIVQEGDPRTLYAAPQSTFAASFLGAANIVPGHIESGGAGDVAIVVLDGAGHRLAVAAGGRPGDAVDVVIRPEDLQLSAAEPERNDNVLVGKIARLTFLGGLVEYHIDCGTPHMVRATGRADSGLAPGGLVWIGIDAKRIAVLARQEGARVPSSPRTSAPIAT